VRNSRRRWFAWVTRGRSLRLTVYSVDDSGSPKKLVDATLSMEKLGDLDGVPEDVKSGISYALSECERLLDEEEARIALSRVPIVPRRVSERSPLAEFLARTFIEEFGAVALFYRTGRGRSFGGVFCFEDGIYRECEDWLRTQAARFLTNLQRLALSRGLLDEVLEVRIPSYNQVEVSSSRKPLVAFSNGVFDFESFMVYGDLERALKPFDRSLFVMHRIPHDLNIELVKRGREGLERYIPPRSCEDVLAVLSTLSPKSYELLRTWASFNGVSEELLQSRICFLLEMIGRALFPGYSLFGSIVFKDLFVVVDPPDAAKTTLLARFMGETILRNDNWRVSSISSITTRDPEDARRVFGSLYNVLAVVVPDVSRNDRVGTWSWVRSISGGDPVEARRLRENVFSYFPDYKFYIAANTLPPIREEGDSRVALLRRAKVIELKNVITEPEVWLDRLSKEDLEATIIASLYALRLVYLRRGSYSNTGIASVEDLWLRYSEPVFRLIMELVEMGRLKLDPNLSISTEDLYSIVTEYSMEKAREMLERGELEDEGDEESAIRRQDANWLGADQSVFTRKAKKLLAVLGVKYDRSSGRRFKGIGLPRRELKS
jgi:hypothetical protein